MNAQVGSLYTSLTLESSSFSSGLRKSVKEATEASDSIVEQFDKIREGTKLFIEAEAIRGLSELLVHSLEFAGSLNEVSQQLGVTAKDLQLFRFAGSQVGLSNEEMDNGLRKFTKTLSEARAGVATAVGVFHELGFTDAQIKNLTEHDAILKTADGISQLKDSVTQAAPAVALFGRAGQQMLPFLTQGSEGINRLAKEASDLGYVLDSDQIKNAEVTAHKLQELKDVFEATIAGAVADNANAILEFAKALEELVVTGGKAFKVMDQLHGAFQVGEGYLTAGAGMNIHALTLGLVGSDTTKRGFDEVDAGMKRLQSGPDKVPGGDEQAKHGNKNYEDPTAAAARRKKAEEEARKADAARKAEAERAKRVSDEIGKLDDTYLSGKESLTSDVVERAHFERQQLSTDTARKLADLAADVTAKKVKEGVEEDTIKKDILRNDLQSQDLINHRENIALAAEDLAVTEARLSTSRDLLGEQENLAKTAAERRKLELEALANARAAEEAQLKPILDDAARTGDHRYSEGDRTKAQDRAGQLDAVYGAKTDSILKATQGPGAQYLDGLTRSAGQAQEALEGVAVEGLKGLEDGLAGAISGTEKLGDVFKNVAAQIVASLAKIAIEKEIIGPLASKLFGGSSLSSISGSPYTAPGGDISIGHTSIPTIDTSNLLGLATGGSFKVGGYGGTDSQLIPLMLSPGEMVNVQKGESSARAQQVLVTPSRYFDVAVADVAGPMANDAAVKGAAGGSALARADSAKRATRRMR